MLVVGKKPIKTKIIIFQLVVENSVQQKKNVFSVFWDSHQKLQTINQSAHYNYSILVIVFRVSPLNLVIKIRQLSLHSA